MIDPQRDIVLRPTPAIRNAMAMPGPMTMSSEKIERSRSWNCEPQ